MKKLLQCQEKYFYKTIGAMINISIAEERKRNKEAFRKLNQKAGSKEEDVMSRFYEITSNLKKYGDNGMINIMAYRIDMPQEVNDKQTRALISDLWQSGYLFLPTYGRHKGGDGLDDEYVPSFIVFNEAIAIITTSAKTPASDEETLSILKYFRQKTEQHGLHLNLNFGNDDTPEKQMQWQIILIKNKLENGEKRKNKVNY